MQVDEPNLKRRHYCQLLYRCCLVCYTNQAISNMMNLINATKSALRRTPALRVYQQFLHVKALLSQTQIMQRYQHRKYIQEWIKAGQPLGPLDCRSHPIIKEYARKFQLHIFVETGTHMGITLNAVKDIFDEIYSIELAVEFYKYAKSRFANMKHITIIEGDSSKVLGKVLSRINKPCLFFLDAHCSGFNLSTQGKMETAIVGELRHIFNHPLANTHVILIDNAECFTGEHDYPTIDNLREMAESAGLDSFEVKDNVISIHRLTKSALN